MSDSPKAKALNFKKLTHTNIGTVHKLVMGGDDWETRGLPKGHGKVTIKHGDAPKRKKGDDKYIGDNRPTSEVHMPHSHMRKLRPGQKVKIHVEPC